MKQIKLWNKAYGLRARFGRALIASGLICLLTFLLLYFGSDLLLTEYLAKSSFEERQLQRQAQSLQEYLDDQEVTVDTLDQLERWARKQPLMLLALYTEEGDRIYSSFNQSPNARRLSVVEREYDELHMFSIRIGGVPATAVLYGDFSYRFSVVSTTSAIALSLILFVLLFLRSSSQLIDYICKLNEEVQIIEGGNLDYPVSVQGNDEVTDLAESMGRMKDSFREQMETEQALHEANRRLVTEMSHDLRTPLTSLMLYTEILRTHRYGSEAQLEEYLEKIDAKAHHLKTLTDHLFEYSLQGGAPKYQEPITLEQALAKPLADIVYDLKVHGFTVVQELDWQPCFVHVKAEYISRILENIGSNLVRYADADTPVHIATLYEDGQCGLTFLNRFTPKMPEGSGIGLDSVRTMMTRMNGLCTVEETEAAFALTLLFPRR